MSGTKKQTHKHLHHSVNLSGTTEIEYWSKKFGISQYELEKLVKEVGNNPENVHRTIQKAREADNIN